MDEVDPNSETIRDIDDIPQFQKNIFKHFFEHYKELENGKFMEFIGFKGKKVATDLILSSYKESD